MRSLSKAPIAREGQRIAQTDLMETQAGRELLSYAIGCALPEGAQLRGKKGNTTYLFRGRLGLAPEWRGEALEQSGQRWVTACLLAHANGYGVSTPISLRGSAPALQVSAQEARAFPVQEASFYGNVFVDEVKDDLGAPDDIGLEVPDEENWGALDDKSMGVPDDKGLGAPDDKGLGAPGEEDWGAPGEENWEVQQQSGVVEQEGGILEQESIAPQLFACAGRGMQSAFGAEDELKTLRACAPGDVCPLEMTGACKDITPAAKDVCVIDDDGGFSECYVTPSQGSSGWGEQAPKYEEVITVNLRPSDFEQLYGDIDMSAPDQSGQWGQQLF